MKRYKEDMGIVLLSLAIAVVSAGYFFGFLKREKQAEAADIYSLLPDEAQSLLAVNQPVSFAQMVLDKPRGEALFATWLPEIFVRLLQENRELPFVLFAFHPEGVVCYAQADKSAARQIEKNTLRAHFPSYAPEEMATGNIRLHFYPDTAKRFLGCFQHDGLWVASYSKKLLDKAAKRLVSSPGKGGGSEALRHCSEQFDRRATANMAFPGETFPLPVVLGDSIVWHQAESWISADLFSSEGNLCCFCTFPKGTAADSLYSAAGDSLTARLKTRLPAYPVLPQVSLDGERVYVTLCTPL